MANPVSTPLATAAPAGTAPTNPDGGRSLAGRESPAGPAAPTIILTAIANPRVELLFYSLIHWFENVSFQPLCLEDLLPPAEHGHTDRDRSTGSGHPRAAGLLVDEASLGLPGVETLAERLPHRVIRQRGTERTEPLPPKWGDSLDMRLPVAQFISELAAWLNALPQQSQTTQAVASGAEPPALTARERQILDGLTTGARYVDIADKLGLSVDTIRGHLKRAYRKLRVQSRTAAVAAYLCRLPSRDTEPRHETVAGNTGDHPDTIA